MATAASKTIVHGNAYNIFIFVVTIVSLVIMVLLWLPFSAETKVLLGFYDNLVCAIFLADFFTNLKQAPSKRGSSSANAAGWICSARSQPSEALRAWRSCASPG